MRELIENFSSTRKLEFREKTMKICEWTLGMYYDRYCGRIKLTGAENYICRKVAKKLSQKDKIEAE